MPKAIVRSLCTVVEVSDEFCSYSRYSLLLFKYINLFNFKKMRSKILNVVVIRPVNSLQLFVWQLLTMIQFLFDFVAMTFITILLVVYSVALSVPDGLFVTVMLVLFILSFYL